MRRLVAGVGLGWAVVVAAMLPVSAQNIQDPSNKHNLAVTSNNTIESTTQTEICIFCHAPQIGRAHV